MPASRLNEFTEKGRELAAKAEAACGTAAMVAALLDSVDGEYRTKIGYNVAVAVVQAAIAAANAKADELLAEAFGTTAPPVPGVTESTS